MGEGSTQGGRNESGGILSPKTCTRRASSNVIGDVAFFNLSKQRAESILVLWRMTAKNPALWTRKFAPRLALSALRPYLQILQSLTGHGPLGSLL